MAKRNQQVVLHDGEWAVRGVGSQRASSVHPTQHEAIDAAQEIARNQGSELFIHGRDGRIWERNSYGDDPFLPPSKKVIRLLGCRGLATPAPLRRRGCRYRLYVPNRVLSRNPAELRLFGLVRSL